MEVISSPQARPPIGTRAPAAMAGWENCVRIPGPLQLLLLHLLVLILARSPHAPALHAILCRALPLSPRLREILVHLVQSSEQDDSVLRPAHARGADQIIIALAHRAPPRDPSRPARTPQLRPRPSRDPPRPAPAENESGGTGPHPAPPPHAPIVTLSNLNHARRTS